MIGSDIARFFTCRVGRPCARRRRYGLPVRFRSSRPWVRLSTNQPTRHRSPTSWGEGEILAANAPASITWLSCLAAGASLGGLVAELLTRSGVRAQRVLISGIGGAHRTHEIRGAAHGRAAAWTARRRLGGFQTDDRRGAPCSRQRPPHRDRACEVRHWPAGRQRSAARVRPRFSREGRQARPYARRHAGDEPARGAGALLGPLRLAGERHSRLRTGILAGLLSVAAASCAWVNPHRLQLPFWRWCWRTPVRRLTGSSPRRCYSSTRKTRFAGGFSPPITAWACWPFRRAATWRGPPLTWVRPHARFGAHRVDDAGPGCTVGDRREPRGSTQRASHSTGLALVSALP